MHSIVDVMHHLKLTVLISTYLLNIFEVIACRYGAGILVGTALVTLLKRTAIPLGANFLSPCFPVTDNMSFHALMDIIIRTVIIPERPRQGLLLQFPKINLHINDTASKLLYLLL